MFDVITVGSASRDIFFITERSRIISDPSTIEGKLVAFILGAKVSIENAHFSGGGGALNASIAFARLGLSVAPYVNVGKDEMGEQILVELIQEGTGTDFVHMDEELRTGTGVIITPEGAGDRTILFYSGANRRLAVHDWDRIKDTRWLYISPVSRQAEGLHENLIEFAHDNSIKVANNPGLGQIEYGFDYMEPLMKKLDILIVNKTEATLLLRSKDPGIATLEGRGLAAELAKVGPRIAVVTCGSEGSYAAEGDTVYFQEVIRTDIADVTGAGDAFGSTFVGSLVLGHDIPTAMFMAALNASSVVGKVGAHRGLLRLDEIRRRALSGR